MTPVMRNGRASALVTTQRWCADAQPFALVAVIRASYRGVIPQ
ncbi:hypothetical protein EDD94_4262 [Streptomyces sp. PanSC9]|nr:hypothetical protein EDD94_4262 [Streptomyces sp. PanSC9]